MSLKKIFIYITLIILTIIGVFFYYINRPNYQICHVEKNNFYINNIKLELESACTLKQLEQGLMFRNSLDKNKGMIFIFPEKNHYNFWMKNTYIPLSIAFLDDNLKIIDIKEMKALDLTQTGTNEKFKYAIEMNSNWFYNNNVKIGDKLIIK